MASLNIDFSYDDNVKRSINGAKSSLSTRINDYAGIKRNLSNMSSSTGNLSTANTYIQKKINALQNKYDKLESFRTAVTNFNTNAEAADRRVANRINTETNQFYKREGIQTGILYSIGSVIGRGAEWLKGNIEAAFTAVVTWAKTTWETVKQWYEDNKWWVDVIVDAFLVVAAIVAMFASGGILAAVFATWGFVKAYTDLCYDSIALSAYLAGDYESYEELSQKGLKDLMKEELGSAGEFLYYGMEIASAIYGIYKIGTSVKTWYTSGKDFSKIIQNSTGIKWATTDGWKSLEGIKKLDIVLGDVSFAVKTIKNFVSEDNGLIAVIKSIKITKIGWDLAANFDSIRNMFNSSEAQTTIAVPTVSIAPDLLIKPKFSVSINLSSITVNKGLLAA